MLFESILYYKLLNSNSDCDFLLYAILSKLSGFVGFALLGVNICLSREMSSHTSTGCRLTTLSADCKVGSESTSGLIFRMSCFSSSLGDELTSCSNRPSFGISSSFVLPVLIPRPRTSPLPSRVWFLPLPYDFTFSNNIKSSLLLSSLSLRRGNST